MNKISAFFTAALFTANLFGAATAADAAGTAAFSASASPSTVTVGANTTFSLYENGDNINVVTGNFVFDSSKLQFISSTCAGSFSGTANVTSSSVSCFVPGGAAVSGTQKFASITFATIGTGNASLTVTGSQIVSAGTNLWNGAQASAATLVNAPAATPTPVQPTPAQPVSTPTNAPATPVNSNTAASTTNTVASTTPTAESTPTPTPTEGQVEATQATRSATPTPTTAPSTVVKSSHHKTPWIIGAVVLLLAASAGAYWYFFRRNVNAKKS